MANAAIGRERVCVQCGTPYIWVRGSGTKYRGCCSLDCFRAKDAKRQADWQERNRKPRHCIGCGIDVGKRLKRCGPCNAEHYRGYGERRARALGVRLLAEAIAESRKGSVRYAGLKCRKCGEAFVPKSTDRLTYCSRRCSVLAKAEAAVIRAEAQQVLKVETDALRAIAREMRRRLARISQIKGWIHRATAPCLACALPIGAKRARVSTTAYCSVKCVQTQPHYAESKRVARLKGKARKRAATVESVSPTRVFERDGWMCHLCGGKTLKDKRGTYHPKAPELDHIVPLSKGGEHSYRNTACAHRKCNAAKSDTIMGQPSLLAA